MPIVLKSGSLNLLEPSGPVQACNGIALPFSFKNSCFLTMRVRMCLIPRFRRDICEFRAGRLWRWRATSHSHRPMLFYGSTGKRKTFAVFIGKSFLWDPPSSVVLPTRSCPFWQTPHECPLWRSFHTVCRHSAVPPNQYAHTSELSSPWSKSL